MGLKKRFFLHMGLPKCASTSLQDTLVHAQTLSYLGKTTAGEFVDPLITEFARVISIFGDSRLRNCDPHRKAFSAAIDQSVQDSIWLSDEVLSSAGFAAYGQSNSLPQILENFKRVIPLEIEPIIIIRNQRALLRSYFRQWIQWGSADSFEEFIRFVLLRRDRFLYPLLNYVNLVRVLRQITPLVHVLSFEELMGNSEYRARKLDAFGAGDIAGLLGQTHSRPAESDAGIKALLLARQPAHFVAQWNWLARSQYPDLYAYRPVKTEFGSGIISFLSGMEQKMQNPGQLAKRRDEIQENDLYFLPAPLESLLDDHIKRVNVEIEALDPEIDWRKSGY